MSVPGPAPSRQLPVALNPRQLRAQHSVGVERALLTLGVLVLAGVLLGGLLALAARALLPDQEPAVGSGPIPDTTSAGAATGAPSRSAAPPAAGGGELRPQSVSAYDPQGDEREGNAAADRAIDGNPDTAWATERYENAQMRGLKDGVGLMVDLGAERQVSAATVRLAAPGASIELRSAETADADVDSTRLLAEVTDAGETATLTASAPATTRYVVLWLTALPAADSGFRAEIRELTVRG